MEEYLFELEMDLDHFILFYDLEEVFPDYAAAWDEYQSTAELIDEQRQNDADKIFRDACHIAFDFSAKITVQVDANHQLDISIVSPNPMTFLRDEPSHFQLISAIQLADYFTVLFKQEEKLYELSFQVDLTGVPFE